jgi:SAM-dependent MidA family methyltransferase
MSLPKPSWAEEKIVARLTDKMRQTSKEPYWFLDFMTDALYEPEDGYYRNTRPKFGPAGDFITAPVMSFLFGQTLAKEIRFLLAQLTQKNILEFGAGQGHLCADILNVIGSDIEQYFILEVSPFLIQEQQKTLQKVAPEWEHKVTWISTLSEAFVGVMLANEVLDAMPVHRFCVAENGFLAEQVVWQAGGWQSVWAPPPPFLEKELKAIEETLPEPFLVGYQSEFNPWIRPWMKSVGESLSSGAVLIIDYGFPRREFYHPHRKIGTLMCHYKHHAHTNPFQYMGIQDITTHVDFTQVAEAAVEVDFQVAGYATQAAFLLSLGILEVSSETVVQKQALQTLLMPGEMGDLFKVILLTKPILKTIGFSVQDDRIRL